MFKNVSKEELVVPASMNYLKQVRDFIEQIGKKYKFSEKVINSFKLVVDESCTNIIRHGYQDNKNGEITVRAIIRRLSLTIVIVDQGRSFDPRQVRDPDLKKYVQIGKKGGLGIFMMRKLMDDIQYNLTSNGNELRLTKMRETVQDPRWVIWWDSLSLRRKYWLISCLGMIVATGLTYFFLVSGIESDLRQEIYAETSAITRNFAETTWSPIDRLNEEGDIPLYEVANSFYQSHKDVVQMVLVTQPNYDTWITYPDAEFKFNNPRIDFSAMSPENRFDDVTIFKAPAEGRMGYYFVSPIQQKTLNEDIRGYAVLWLDDESIESTVGSQKADVAGKLAIGFLLLVGALALLVTFITRPFHSLAEWVRQVGRGQVDEDEIDIDGNDEIGEIAQAFNEMTSKFREAQLSVIEQQRLQKELQVAQEIQQMLLPDDFPDVIGYEIATYYQSAKEVGGDLFDFMEVDEQSIGICVADVSGKGIPGSLVMTMIRTSLRLEARGNKNPADILTKVNGFVTDDIRKGMFVTMLYVILDSRERMVSFASAGHNPMILYRGKSKETFYLNPSGFPVGITLPDIKLFGERVQADRIRLHPDDIFVLYTDGITEAMNASRELYGEARFLAAIRKFGHLDVTDFVTSLKDDILDFTGGFEQNDDITLVAIKENMAAVDIKVDSFKTMFERLQNEKDLTVAECCKAAGISPTTFYRYRRIYNEGGYDLLREMLHGYTNLGLRHMSIEVKTKMYDIIRDYPEFGPKKISDLLNTEKYNFTEIAPVLIYEELRRAKLNTKERRGAFVKRGGKQRLKPPGTPLLTLDGEVLVGFRSEDKKDSKLPYMPPVPQQKSGSREKLIAAKGKNRPQEAAAGNGAGAANNSDSENGASGVKPDISVPDKNEDNNS